MQLDLNFHEAYHKFVNTTPKPSATKKSSGELVGPPPPPPFEEDDGVADGGVDVVEGAIVEEDDVE